MTSPEDVIPGGMLLCPACRGRCEDKHGEPCERCHGEGEIERLPGRHMAGRPAASVTGLNPSDE